MDDLYHRLTQVGFGRAYVRERLLPDWWDDCHGAEASTRALAEFAIARLTGIEITNLRAAGVELRLPGTKAKLKLRGDAKPPNVAPGLAVAERAARLCVGALQVAEEPSFPKFAGIKTAESVRTMILASAGMVTLDSLLSFAWASGIVVLHIAPPAGSRRFDGMALFVGETPAVVLSSARKGPPWIAFHLAHELGHILLGHVDASSEPLADVGLEGDAGGDQQESEADAFAVELLVGKSPPTQPKAMNADQLSRWARREGAERRIDPGSLALVASHQRKRIPAGTAALKFLGRHTGAHEMIVAALVARMPEGVPEDIHRLMPGAVRPN